MTTVPELYAAMASVAAITTALQAAVALQFFGEASRLAEESAKAAPNTAGASESRVAAGRVKRGALLLNSPAILVNASVIASWGGSFLGATVSWVLLVPWVAIGVAGLFLGAIAFYSIRKLHGLETA